MLSSQPLQMRVYHHRASCLLSRVLTLPDGRCLVIGGSPLQLLVDQVLLLINLVQSLGLQVLL
jgi:hypothetical protein